MHSEACTKIEYDGSASDRQVQRFNLSAASLQRGLRTSGHPNVDRAEVAFVVFCYGAHVAGAETSNVYANRQALACR